MATISITVNNTPNLTIVNLPSAKLYFSYETLVAFYTPETGKVVHENIWSMATGRHLNVVDGGGKAKVAERVDSETFETKLQEAGLA